MVTERSSVSAANPIDSLPGPSQHCDRPVRVSVVIPVKNGEATIGACLRGVLSQVVPGGLEVIVIDSGSTDRSLDVISSFPAKIHRIPPHEFNHGDTRNLGVRMACGEFVVMTVQDANPADPQWIRRMLQGFDDPRVAGVCGLQYVPHDPDKNPMQWFRPCSEAQPRVVHFADPKAFSSLSPRAQAELCRWDDVTAMYRRSALLETPFRRTAFAEDVMWARDVLLKGYALVYEPRAQVCHYHHESCSSRFRRAYTTHYHLYRCFNHPFSTAAVVCPLASCIYHLGRERTLSPLQRVRWILYNGRLIFSEWLAALIFNLVRSFFRSKVMDLSHTRFCGPPNI